MTVWSLDWPSFAWGFVCGLVLLCLNLLAQLRWLRKHRKRLEEALR